MIYTQKEEQGQYLYTERRGASGTATKDAALNAGVINAVIGRNESGSELYVYQKVSRKDERIAVFTQKNGAFEKVEERRLPKMRNNSYNLGLFLSEDKSRLFISAELGRTRGRDDIYQSRWENGKWSKPKNMGKAVNTREAEFAPFATADSLFFSRQRDTEAYVYGVPLDASKAAAGEPVMLTSNVNQDKAFNAYYRRDGEKETWLSVSQPTATAQATYTAYASVAESVPAVVAAPAPNPTPAPVAVQAPAPVEPTPVKAAAADLVLSYGFNRVFTEETDLRQLNKLLASQPKGAKISVKGYSDAFGTAEAKQRVSRKRAVFVKWYIDNYFSGKGFEVTLENVVAEEKGSGQRKTEITVAK
ncbi:hypothetical protein [Pontibacter harenae]|uniref:hypothetical protein n=1 Tax=Pontibacter harenae TaxID=2894083 RepID=UPI001E3EEB19|nr:hypothetical protein [Pontibacter harenae]MCC9166336.1 hypothetical protein [Pontibacter harenae]